MPLCLCGLLVYQYGAIVFMRYLKNGKINPFSGYRTLLTIFNFELKFSEICFTQFLPSTYDISIENPCKLLKVPMRILYIYIYYI
jgi:hypothetical protein